MSNSNSIRDNCTICSFKGDGLKLNIVNMALKFKCNIKDIIIFKSPTYYRIPDTSTVWPYIE